MRQRSPQTLQVAVLVSAAFLEVAANFAANAVQSPVVRSLDRLAPFVVIVLLGVVVVGQVVVHRQTHPAAPQPAWDPQDTPYPGLAAFGRSEAAVFFGRDEEVTQIVRRLNTSAPDPQERFVCVTGMSGSGKSSLVHAGVLPRLLRSRWTVLPMMVPGAEPLQHLAGSLGTRTPGGVLPGRTLLVIDQLEELITDSRKPSTRSPGLPTAPGSPPAPPTGPYASGTPPPAPSCTSSGAMTPASAASPGPRTAAASPPARTTARWVCGIRRSAGTAG